MKISVDCNTCKIQFPLTSEYLAKKDSIVCPNCGSQFPQESFELLKTGIISITKSRNLMPQRELDFDYCRLFDFEVSEE